MNFILIDGSYYIFYRFYALEMWWKHSNQNENQEYVEPCKSPLFIDKFKKTFASNIAGIEKKLGIETEDAPVIMVATDCPRNQIWRRGIYPEYKGTRKNNVNVGDFFRLVYDENLFNEAGVQKTLSYKSLEADDCIAITTRHIQSNYPDAHIWIITSDMDYLQLCCDNVRIFNLKYKELNKTSRCLGDPKMDLFCKIVAGDKSDNIPAVFNKCGIKTAIKYYNSPELFNDKLNGDVGAQEKYKRNQSIIDFNCIPEDLVSGFQRDALGKIVFDL